jgi:hypothetical protein
MGDQQHPTNGLIRGGIASGDLPKGIPLGHTPQNQRPFSARNLEDRKRRRNPLGFAWDKGEKVASDQLLVRDGANW